MAQSPNWSAEMKLSPHAIFSLSQALNHLREAAEFTEQPLKDDINELADELEFLKLEGLE